MPFMRCFDADLELFSGCFDTLTILEHQIGLG